MTTRRTLLEETKERDSMESLSLSMTMSMITNRVSMGGRVSMMMKNHCQQEKMLRKKSLKQQTM